MCRLFRQTERRQVVAKQSVENKAARYRSAVRYLDMKFYQPVFLSLFVYTQIIVESLFHLFRRVACGLSDSVCFLEWVSSQGRPWSDRTR